VNDVTTGERISVERRGESLNAVDQVRRSRAVVAERFVEAIAHTTYCEGFEEMLRPRRVVIRTCELEARVVEFQELVEEGVRDAFHRSAGK
jgi:hypothetical protein